MKKTIKVNLGNWTKYGKAMYIAKVANPFTGKCYISLDQEKTMKYKGALTDDVTDFVGEQEYLPYYVYFSIKPELTVKLAENVHDLTMLLNHGKLTEDVELPTFGGRKPKNMEGVLSWDKNFVMIKNFRGEFISVPR